MIYYFFFFIISFLSIFNILKDNNRDWYYATVPLASILILFAGLRFETGPDYGSYKAIFDITGNEFKPDYGEPLFAILGYVIGLFTKNFNALLFVVACTAVSLKFYFLKRYSKYLFVSLLLYYVTNYLSQDFGQIRQGLAIAICMIALHNLFLQNRKKFTFLVLLAAMFHFSAIIFLLALLVERINFTWQKMLVIWVACLVLSNALSFLSGYIMLLDVAGQGRVIGDKLSYLTSEQYGNKIPINLGMFFKMAILIISKRFEVKYPSIIPKIGVFINLYFIGGCIFFLFSFVEIYAGRLSIYFLIFELVLIPYIISCCKETVFKILAFSLVWIYAAYLLYQQFYVIKGTFLLPYQDIFNQ